MQVDVIHLFDLAQVDIEHLHHRAGELELQLGQLTLNWQRYVLKLDLRLERLDLAPKLIGDVASVVQDHKALAKTNESLESRKETGLKLHDILLLYNTRASF